MKKLFFLMGFFVCIIIMLASCSKSPEQKVKNLVEVEIKKNLYFPESYNLADVKIDSAFAPYDSPEFMEITFRLIKLCDELSGLQKEIKDKKTVVSIYNSPYDSFSRNQLNDAKEELAEAQAKEEKAMDELQTLEDRIKVMMDKKPEFIGFRAAVSYRAKENMGLVFMNHVIAFFDKNIEKVVYMCEGNQYEHYCQMVKEIQEAGDSAE